MIAPARDCATAEVAPRDPRANAALEVLRLLFGRSFASDFGVELWDGTRVRAAKAERFVLQVNAPGALRLAFTPPVDLSTGRAFGAGLLDARGDLESAVDAFYRVGKMPGPLRMVRMLAALRRLPAIPPPELPEAKLRGGRHSRARDRAAIGFHYDQPVEFYRAFLGRAMNYSSAYFDDGCETLDAAQSAKMDYVLRKLRLRPGERLLDVGCGWGGLVLRAAQRFGAHVLGITLSARQLEEARRRIADGGVFDRARVELRDYRDLRGECFDKIVSIGMFEHVGRAKLPEYFRAIYRALRPGGLFLNTGISHQDPRSTGKVTGFMDRLIFPDGELVPISEALNFSERAGFEVRDVESLREHYMRTTREWVANLERNRAAAVAAAGEVTYRLWRLYLAGSAQGFRAGRIGIYQSLLARPRAGGFVELPATRRDLYVREVADG
ncbi:MAG TPA: cyclopropane-fatty-acyl-phospholipid synthase family protein [Candidatus Cybelea sp.]|nr:cyclopropane-fatty-acyl-phospholipid synthase family protein [Candidatus Cybelea sp.]